MALANTLKVLSGGFRSGWFYPVDGDGYFCGITGGSLTPGATGQGGYYLDGVKSAGYKGIEPLVLLGTGEDQPLGQLIEPPQTLPAFDIMGSIGDLTLDALQQSTKVYAQGNASYGIIQPYLPNYIPGALLMERLSMSRDAATLGAANWDLVMFPKTQFVPMSSDGMAEKKITDFKRHVICNPTTIWPNGAAVTSSTWGTTNGVEFPGTSPNKVLMFAWKGTGAVTAFNMPITAIPGSNTLAVGFPNITLVEGAVVTPVVTLVGSNYVITISPAPAVNARIIGTFEYL